MELDGATPNPSSNGGDHNEKEGRFLLGSPSFADIGNGRLRCLETGHELPAADKDFYAASKGCRRALVDAALAHHKPPLNMFKPCPASKSKLVCKLTGDTINKSEEHIWKHISGRRFLHKLEQKEMEKMTATDGVEKENKKSKKGKKNDKIAVEKAVEEEDAEMAQEEQDADGGDEKTMGNEPAERSSDSEEPDFWVPPVGSRWDMDDGKDRWESCESPDGQVDEETGLVVDEKEDAESSELSMRRTKRMTIAMGPSSFASRKKKIKTLPSTGVDK